MIRVQLDAMRRLVTAIFGRAGCPADEAERIAYYLTTANLTGHDSHGVIRVPRYVDWLEQGYVLAGKQVATVLDGGSLLVLDGQHGFGQSVGPEACALGCERARSNGVAVVALRNAGHLGRIGDFAEMAIADGLVSLHFVNVFGSLLVAPFGGKERRFSTNPIAIGVPTGDDRPFVLDMATALVAEGKVLVASQGGKPVPKGALVSAAGELSDDPAELYGDLSGGAYPDPRRGPGAMRAFGDHKGSGLALACDLLGGALSGSGITRKLEGRVHNGMFSIYVDPRRLDTERTFAADVMDYVEWIRGCAPIDTQAGVLIPGDKERQTRAERTAEGLPLTETTWSAILQTARRVGLDEAGIGALTA
jgi:hydroxycarboxylate dehydrogenase B